MVTSIYTAKVKLNKTDKDYTKVILIFKPEEGLLVVQNTLFVISFESFEEFAKQVDYTDVLRVGDVNL